MPQGGPGAPGARMAQLAGTEAVTGAPGGRGGMGGPRTKYSHVKRAKDDDDGGFSPSAWLHSGIDKVKEQAGGIRDTLSAAKEQAHQRAIEIRDAHDAAKRNVETYDMFQNSPWVPGGMAVAGASLGSLAWKKHRLLGALLGGGAGTGLGLMVDSICWRTTGASSNEARSATSPTSHSTASRP